MFGGLKRSIPQSRIKRPSEKRKEKNKKKALPPFHVPSPLPPKKKEFLPLQFTLVRLFDHFKYKLERKSGKKKSLPLPISLILPFPSN